MRTQRPINCASSEAGQLPGWTEALCQLRHSGLLLNVIVRKRAPVLELLSGEYEGLLRSGWLPSLSWILLLIISIVYFRATRTSRKNKETGKRRLHPLEAKTKTQTSTCASAPSLDQNRSSSHLSVKNKCSNAHPWHACESMYCQRHSRPAAPYVGIGDGGVPGGLASLS